MPIYKYRCKVCKHSFELLQSLNADTVNLKCPECGASNPEKRFSSFSSKTNNCSSSGFS